MDSTICVMEDMRLCVPVVEGLMNDRSQIFQEHYQRGVWMVTKAKPGYVLRMYAWVDPCGVHTVFPLSGRTPIEVHWCRSKPEDHLSCHDRVIFWYPQEQRSMIAMDQDGWEFEVIKE